MQLLQTALSRSGRPLDTDGIFGPKTRRALISFQADKGLNPDGIAGKVTHRALLPWYTGYMVHTIAPGDTFFFLSQRYNSSVQAIQTANPDAQAENLRIGSQIIIPLNFPVVPTDIDVSSSLIAYCVQGLAARYPFISRG